MLTVQIETFFYYIYWSVFRLVIDTPNVFSDYANAQQVDAVQKQYREHNRWKPSSSNTAKIGDKGMEHQCKCTAQYEQTKYRKYAQRLNRKAKNAVHCVGEHFSIIVFCFSVLSLSKVVEKRFGAEARPRKDALHKTVFLTHCCNRINGLAVEQAKVGSLLGEWRIGKKLHQMVE